MDPVTAVHLGSTALLVSTYKGLGLRFTCNYEAHVAPFISLMCKCIFYVNGFKGF